MSQLLEDLKASRAMLEKCWVPWTAADGKGGHCHSGCAYITTEGFGRYELVMRSVDIGAKLAFPELRGAIEPRPKAYQLFESSDIFDRWPAIFVNNHGCPPRGIGGKEAILMAYDDAIATEEVAELCREEAEKALSGRVDIAGLLEVEYEVWIQS